MTPSGRLWTMLVIGFGVVLIFGSVGLVTEYLVTEATSGRRVGRRMTRQVEELRDHFVLCGYGRVGSTVARELVHDGERFVVIDVNPESLKRARDDGCLVVEGDATDDATLRAGGIGRAKGLVATIDSDAQNVYVILSARALNPGLFVVGRASTPAAEEKLARAGADRVVSPYTMAGRRLAELAVRPRVVDFLDAALSHGELSFSLEEFHVRAGGPLDGAQRRPSSASAGSSCSRSSPRTTATPRTRRMTAGSPGARRSSPPAPPTPWLPRGPSRPGAAPCRRPEGDDGAGDRGPRRDGRARHAGAEGHAGGRRLERRHLTGASATRTPRDGATITPASTPVAPGR